MFFFKYSNILIHFDSLLNKNNSPIIDNTNIQHQFLESTYQWYTFPSVPIKHTLKIEYSISKIQAVKIAILSVVLYDSLYEYINMYKINRCSFR